MISTLTGLLLGGLNIFEALPMILQGSETSISVLSYALMLLPEKQLKDFKDKMDVIEDIPAEVGGSIIKTIKVNAKLILNILNGGKRD